MVSSWSDVQLNTHMYGPVGHKCRFCTFVDCSNYITLEQLVALRWRCEMFVCLVWSRYKRKLSVFCLFLLCVCLRSRWIVCWVAGWVGWLVVVDIRLNRQDGALIGPWGHHGGHWWWLTISNGMATQAILTGTQKTIFPTMMQLSINLFWLHTIINKAYNLKWHLVEIKYSVKVSFPSPHLIIYLNQKPHDKFHTIPDDDDD